MPICCGWRTGGLPKRIDSICVHSDSASAVASAQQIRSALEAAGYTLVGLDRLA